MFDVPEGMSIVDFNRHPVSQMLRHAASVGEEPSKQELDALEIPTSARSRLRDVTRELVAIHREGLRQDAWKKADEYAVEVVASLPDELKNPDYQQPVTLDPTLGPDALADLVPRVGGLRS